MLLQPLSEALVSVGALLAHYIRLEKSAEVRWKGVSEGWCGVKWSRVELCCVVLCCVVLCFVVWSGVEWSGVE